MMANLVAHSGDNKGQLTTLAKAICRDFRQHDEAEEKKLLEWQKQKQTKGANKDKSERPDGCCPVSSIISCPPRGCKDYSDYYVSTLGPRAG